ncbi:MAG: hypothetical protein HWQ38_02375 [Nostoc sp. NMS7]|uniref:hypothetical protein n=1 Tax=Nostoc sp. NMS7 TaxID=2815391 RepID=UPI0025EB1896|nr:hypothetical protein [Nostoc sp. NMS7]MBN3945385.1 hypothetical protein [Nostoc sp. NMS7]
MPALSPLLGFYIGRSPFPATGNNDITPDINAPYQDIYECGAFVGEWDEGLITDCCGWLNLAQEHFTTCSASQQSSWHYLE